MTAAPVAASEVSELLFEFSKAAFAGKSEFIKATPVRRELARGVFDRLANGRPLTIKQVAGMPGHEQRVLYEILAQYIMFLMLNPALPFPPDFLESGTPQRLPSSVGAYIAHHQWPFPQQLPH